MVFDERSIKSKIRDINDYPKKGIIFRDITTLIKDKEAFRICIDQLAEEVKDKNVDYILGIEARGFIFGSALAYRLGKGFIIVRKKGKLPYGTVSKDYALEYGNETIEIHKDSIEKGKNVLIVDDLLATGGTAKAVAELVEELGGKVAGIAFIVELTGLKGRDKLKDFDIISLAKY
jgi:adenine phosphoribosyltransferase